MIRSITPKNLLKILRASLDEYEAHVKKAWLLPFNYTWPLQFFATHNWRGIKFAKQLLKEHPLKAAMGVDQDLIHKVICHFEEARGGTRTYSFKTIFLRNLDCFFYNEKRPLKAFSHGFFAQSWNAVRGCLIRSFKSYSWQKAAYGAEDKPFIKTTRDSIRDRCIKLLDLNPQDIDRATLHYSMLDMINKLKDRSQKEPNNDNAKVCLLILNEIDKFLNIPEAEYRKLPHYRKNTLFNTSNPELVDKLFHGWSQRFASLGIENDYAVVRRNR